MLMLLPLVVLLLACCDHIRALVEHIAEGSKEANGGLQAQGEPLLAQLKQQPFGTTTILSGTSCRQQVQHLATVRTRHMAEVIAAALE